jgi:hypothetical protein
MGYTNAGRENKKIRLATAKKMIEELEKEERGTNQEN